MTAVTGRKLNFVVLPLIGAVSFWLPDTLLHLVRNMRFDVREVIVITAIMPLSLCAAWLTASRILGRGLGSVAPPFLLGVWITGGLFMSIGWVLSVPSPINSVAISTILGLIPIYTFIAAAHDGSLFALLLVSILLFLAWILPMSIAKTQTNNS